MYTLFDYQEKLIKETYFYWGNGDQKVLLQLSTGGGKCLGKDTPVLMYDGRTVPVQDIRVGDHLMGDDSRPRKVLSLARGREEMFRITPVKGDPWECNRSHILSLVWNGPELNGRFGGDVRKKGSIYDISVDEYLALPQSQKHCLKAFRAGIDYPETPVDLDPYFLGVWLGDGTERLTSVCTVEPAIIEHLSYIAEHYGLTVRVDDRADYGGNWRGNHSLIHHLTKGNSGPNQNPLRNVLRKYNLISNKHIPRDYLVNSRSVRLELLAGLLDTDGYLHHGHFEIVQKRETLAKDILFLARSLGFAAYMSPKVVNGVTYHRTTISGDFTVVPCRVKRRQAEERKMNKNVLRTGFSIKSMGEGDYYGFEIDGNRRFLLGDFTVTHNTICAGAITKACINKGHQVLFLAHRTELIMQAKDKIGRFVGVEGSIIKSGYKSDLRSPLQVASVQTLTRRLHLPLNPKLIIVDEAHHVVSNSYVNILNNYHSAYVLGVTATPVRLNGQGFDHLFDSLVVGPSTKELISRGFLSKFKLYADPSPMVTKGVKTQGGDYKTKDVAKVNDALTLSGNLVKSYKLRCPGKRCIVFAVNVEHSQQIAKRYNEACIPAAHLDGTTPENIRQETIAAFSRGELLVLSNVGLFDEGFDLPALDAVQIAKPTKSLTRWLQMVGRVLRTSPDKDYAIILDHTLNFAIHGLPTREREWTLQGVEQKQEPIKVCKETGEVVPNPEKEKTGIEELDVHLIEVDEEEEVKHKEWLDTFEKIKEFQIERGYDNYWLLKKLESLRPPMAIWESYADHVGYKRGWAFYKSKDQKGVWKAPKDIYSLLMPEPAKKKKGVPITLPLDSRTA